MPINWLNIFWDLVGYLLTILLLLSRHRRVFRENKGMTCFIFGLFGIIIAILRYSSESVHIWVNLITIPFLAYYVIDFLNPNPTVTFLEDVISAQDEIIDDPETEESEKEEKTGCLIENSDSDEE